MDQRVEGTMPRPVAVIGWLFVGFGVLASVDALVRRGDDPAEWIPMLITRLLAVIGGAFLLRRCNWARGLIVGWMVFHIFIGFDDWLKVAIHTGLAIALACWLYRPPVSAWFRAS